ncbi:E3 UBIQUITIN-PROTEIN LIGASE PRAJA [Salix purpurea]|uniref:RING-type E3 ubiquitin transferase n=1 Tax=Salix purpurea TaxID=77065 RepID=A0A9Q0WDS9_SALPP|nr:E3 UBIQUITIN-PROTEIN LIGASE PRAJA [Salix purpurea]KAJ6765350.1 E3 UBIQUITIN-PROTEIN LIGASE PRAJA [Salix purpurea]KAJ6765351.1 E3 UBIQUITIN-PROTEIN LIGASE PRAJA [Salix purpurea]KAJ6765352.1 E3 UBIQUITIN-PROTEIN LIGASE PRAJA [Salix purpurea]
MDRDSQRTLHDVPTSTVHGHSTLPAACALCQRILVPDDDDLEIVNICGDCKFLLLEDLERPAQDSHRRRHHRGRRTRYSSAESSENLFSQQFSQVIDLALQNQSTVHENGVHSIDGDSSARLWQHTSSHMTPSSSQRWQCLFSDSESEGFGNVDSLYGESEINFRSSRYQALHSESDANSFSAYGGDSDASVDGHSVLDQEMFIPADEGSSFDSDTDIDPMHAGVHQWNSDDLEEEEDEEGDGDWEEADIEEDTTESVEAGARLRNVDVSSASEINGPVGWHRQFHSPEFEGLNRWRTRQSRQAHNHDFFTNLEESESLQHIWNYELADYVTGFGDLLEALTRSDIGRRGAPPAALSFVNNLPLVIISEEHERHDGVACAICKDLLPIGTEVNQLPCLHLYHPDCILPWLSARNSCPLCRYEFPTDDKDYEESKQNSSTRTGIHDVQQQEVSEDSSSDVSDEPIEHGQSRRELLDVGPPLRTSGREGSRSRWLLLAATPLVSLLGIVLVMWGGNPRGRRANGNFPERGLYQIQVPGSSQPNQKVNERRRWWYFF